MMLIVYDDCDDDSDDDIFGIQLTLRGSSPISQEVSKLAQQCSKVLCCNVCLGNIAVENSDTVCQSVAVQYS